MAKYKLPKIEELLDAGAHYGHQTKRWNPKMEPYIYTVKKNIHIIDLEKTEQLLKDACEFLYQQASEGKQIVFVGTKKQAHEVIEAEAKRSGAFYVTERWIGGTITNFRVIKRNIDKLLNYLRQKENGELEKYTKKERLLIDREIIKLQRNIGGIVGLKSNPDVLFIVDSKRERTSVREAKSAGVPVVALIDTNCDPTDIKHVIPANDDAIKSIAVIMKSIGDAIEEGYVDFAKNKEKVAADKAKAAAPVEEVVIKTDIAEITPLADAAIIAETLPAEPVAVVEPVKVEKAAEPEKKAKKSPKIKKETK
ncbi:MAG TPA: 30S ribosomal protein S2 [Candidatus Saccharimonadales bacterium]|nr:30S ribosomal protein S2 [Candidatus Saccharimonadales bacterium]